jgi:flagellar biosynthesis/type III secretory pathway protein FliH
LKKKERSRQGAEEAKRSLFSNVIKVSKEKEAAIREYAMRDMGLHPEVRREKPSFTLSTGNPPDGGKNVEQLLEEICDREKYIKQMTDKTHTLEKEAYEKGFAQGERAGKELGEKRFDSAIKVFTEAADNLFSLQKKVYQESEQHLVELVLSVARQVVQKEVETDQHILLDIIQSAFRYVADREAITVKLHPSDLEFANQHKAEVIQGIEGLGRLTFEGDENVARGDALIESRLGMVECGIEKHLKDLEESLRTKAQEKIPAVKEQEGDEPVNDS